MPITDIASLETDPVEGAEVMNLLGVSGDDLNIPGKYSKIKDVISYFKGRRDTRYMILKTISGKHGEKLDILWTWVQLQQEKEKRISKLNPTDFTEDIQKELEQKILTKENLDTVKKQTELRVKDAEKRVEELRKERKETREYVNEVAGAVGEATKFKEIKTTISQIELANEALKAYE